MITVFAENGGLTLNGDNGQLASGIQTAKTLSYYIEKFNILDEAIYFSSSMDFAAEDGFETNACAKILFEEGVKKWQMSQ